MPDMSIILQKSSFINCREKETQHRFMTYHETTFALILTRFNFQITSSTLISLNFQTPVHTRALFVLLHSKVGMS